MAAKTSKTAHVMGLLNKTEAPESTEELPTVHAPVHAAPAVEVERESVQLADTVRSALEDAVAAEMPQEAAAPAASAAAPAAVSADVPAEAPPAPAAEEPAPVEIPTAGVAEGVPEPPVPLVTTRASAVSGLPQDDFKFINVMQVLVTDKAQKYMALFGLCQCPHCVADVCALALNNLPPKYVVKYPGDIIPMLSVYEGRFDASVTAQVTRACRIVMDVPHHNRG